jgi:tetratricopeptide (TPR) repeat protein
MTPARRESVMKKIRISAKSLGGKAAAGALGVIVCLVLLEASLWVIPFFVPSQREMPRIENDEKVILCLGDSFTFGYGLGRYKTYPAQLQDLLDSAGYDYLVVNGGVCTQNSAELLARLPSDLAVYHPQIIILLTGGANSWNWSDYPGSRKEAGILSLPRKARIYRLGRLVLPRLIDRVKDMPISGLIQETRASFDLGLSWTLIGKVKEWDGDSEKAAYYYHRALYRHPDNFFALKWLGELLCAYEKPEEALPFFERAKTIYPFDGEFSGYNDPARVKTAAKRCNILFSKGEHSAAFECYMAECREKPFKFRINSNKIARLAGLAGRERDAAYFYAEMASRGVRGAESFLRMLERGDQKMIREWIIDDVRSVIALSAQTGAKVVIQSYPQTRPEPALTGIGAAYVDNFSVFRKLGRPENYFQRDGEAGSYGHCNSTGALIMAKNVFETIKKKGLVK